MAEEDVRSGLVQELFSYLDPLKSHFSADCSRIHLAGGAALYERETIAIEAWARPLWGLVPFWHGGGRSRDGFFEKAYVRGLAAGTDPVSPSFWGGGRDHDQRFVEMAAIAYGLLLAPEVLWEPLSARERKQVASWLDRANHASFPQGNWLWFRSLVNLALRERGMEWNQELLEKDLDTLDGFYRGHGWYADGPEGVFDYYNAMVFHFMGLLYAWLFGEKDPARSERYLARAREFADEFILLFSSRGEAVPFGRSVTYRFAQSCFWSIAFASHADLGERITPGCLLGLVERSIASWKKDDICDNAGIQSIGYGYPCLHMAEGYNAPGSPYWSLMAFACLALPDDDPAWKAAPEPLPELPHLAEMQIGLVARDAEGEVTLYRTGALPAHPFAQSPAKYAKFAYSTRFGFSVARSTDTIEEAAPDSMLAFSLAGHIFVSRGAERSAVHQIGAEELAELSLGDAVPQDLHCEMQELAAKSMLWETKSVWSPWPGVEVMTEIIPLAEGHLRIHHVSSELACEAYDCGYAVPGNYHTLTQEEIDSMCEVLPLACPGEQTMIHAEANTNISHPGSVIPAVKYQIDASENVLATLVHAPVQQSARL
ncbi:MAG: DUF2264 domain-containing protein [Atopobiaceae bacterium]